MMASPPCGSHNLAIMLAQRIDLGPLSIAAAPGWRFFPGWQQIVGRCETRIGGLRIQLDLVGHVPPPRTHRESLALARTFAPKQNPDAPPIHNMHTWSGARLVGALTYLSLQDYVRLYYIHEDTCLVPMWYACKLERRTESPCEGEISACDMMVASLQIRPEVVAARLAETALLAPLAPPVAPP